jgi:hypothetical protein
LTEVTFLQQALPETIETDESANQPALECAALPLYCLRKQICIVSLNNLDRIDHMGFGDHACFQE